MVAEEEIGVIQKFYDGESNFGGVELEVGDEI